MAAMMARGPAMGDQRVTRRSYEMRRTQKSKYQSAFKPRRIQ